MSEEIKAVRETKFNVGKNKPDRTFDGIVFDSVAEMKYYTEVVLPGVESGEIVFYERQKPYVLQRAYMHDGKRVSAIVYKADFFLRFKDGSELVVDIKGCPDAVAKLKRKMFWLVFPDVKYVWIGYSKIDGGWQEYETIQAGRKTRKKEKLKKQKEQKDEKNTNSKKEKCGRAASGKAN